MTPKLITSKIINIYEAWILEAHSFIEKLQVDFLAHRSRASSNYPLQQYHLTQKETLAIMGEQEGLNGGWNH
jgi:hypothetical protein